MDFSWFRRWGGFRRHEDAYAKTRTRLAESIRSAIARQMELNRCIWLVCHHEATFEVTQDQLAHWGYPYRIEMDTIDPNFLIGNDGSELLAPRNVNLVLASLIPSTRWIAGDSFEQPGISMMVLDRHQNIVNDDQIEAFCKNVPFRIELGYFLSLEDELVKTVLNETSLMVLEQLGLDSHDLITSNLITRRLNRKLRREAAN